ncbi:MAG: hypothetical protein GXO63_00925, partial [Candidatus Micrarchaeota archaeon]|nr:hypothetical protein [Candidatus Micrarchaeota archaeon]
EKPSGGGVSTTKTIELNEGDYGGECSFTRVDDNEPTVRISCDAEPPSLFAFDVPQPVRLGEGEERIIAYNKIGCYNNEQTQAENVYPCYSEQDCSNLETLGPQDNPPENSVAMKIKNQGCEENECRFLVYLDFSNCKASQ